MVQYRVLNNIRSVLFNRSARGFRALAAVALALSAAPAANASLTWTKGSYTVASWQAAENNVLNKATCGTSALARLSDGKCEKFSTSGGDGNISNNQVVEWTLASPVYVNGLNVYSWWNDNGRDGINIQKVEVKTQGSDTWVNTGASAVSQDANTSANYVKLSDSTGGLLSDSAVSALRITFGTQDNSKTCYTEVELISVTPSPIPDDPPAGETDYVAVTNGATMNVMQDWTSGTNLVWDFGSGAVPTVYVAEGKTVTIRGEILGSVGFRKLGSGTLVLAHPKTRPVTVSGTFSAADLAAYQRDCRYGITVLPLPHENVLGSCPEVVVSNVVTGAILESGVDYSVAYFATNAPGFGYAVVTGLNAYDGYVSTNDFDVVLESAPSGYRQCDWLYVDNTASTITSFIRTGVTPAGDWKVKIDFATYGMNDWLNTYLFCARTSDGTSKRKLLFFNNYNGHPYIGLADDAYVTASSIDTATWTGEHTFIYENGEVKLDGAVCATASLTSFTCGDELVLFGGYYNQSTFPFHAGYGFTGAFREAKFHDGSGNLRLHLVPCVRESDGAIGVYNLGAENHGFIANGGSGSFAVDGVGLALVKNGSFENSSSTDGKQSSGNWGYMSRTWGGGAARTALWSGSAALTKSNCADWYVPTGFHVGTWCVAAGGSVYQRFYCAKSVKARLTFKYMHRTNYNYDKGVAVIVSLDGGPICSVDVPPSVSTVYNHTLDDVTIPYSPSGHTITFSKSGSGDYFLDNVALVVTEVLGVSGNLELSVPTSAELAPGETLQCAVTNTTTGAALVAGEDYVITTEEVIASSSSSLAGCWRVIATGQGDYAGQAATNYTRIALKEDAEDYDYAMAITPNASYVTSTLVDFPLLVRLSSTRQSGFDPADCGTNGENLRFILADGTMLAHEIDYWDVDGESTVWVRVPALTADTVIYALWSPKSGTVHHLPRNPKAVWCDYVGVWHLSEAGATAYDSSVNNYTAVNASPVSAAANPPVGRAAFATNFFETSVTDLFAADAAKPITSRSRVTFSGWLTVDSAARSDYGSGYYIYKKYVGWNDQTGGGSVCYLPDFVNNPSYSSAIVQVFLNSGTGGSDIVNTYPPGSKVASKRQTWIYLAISLDGATKAYYFDGVQTGTETATHGILGPDNTAPVVFGPHPTKTSTGRGDEIRIRDGAASAAWILADYRNMATQDFVSYAAIGKKTFSVPALADVTLPDVSVAATPAVAPVDDLTGNALTLNTDYTLVYADNTFGNLTGKAIVTGISGYAGCITNTFEILGIVSTDLAADADWTVYSTPRIASSATVDLKGHALRVSALYAGGTVTDSVGGGQLIFDVPAGTTVTLNTALTGALKLVKTGAGVLVASKAGQTYTGGTDVLGGVLRTGGGIATDGWLGPNTSTVRCKVYVGPDGVLDPAGSYLWGYHSVVLDGGSVSNTVVIGNTGDSHGFNAYIAVTGDVAIVTMQNYRTNNQTIDLQGGTMTIENYNSCTLDWGMLLQNGTLEFKRGGWFNVYRAMDMSTCDFRQGNGAIRMSNAMSVHDYYCSYGSDWCEGSAALNVYGTFTPASTYFYGPTMQDGSAIDLSAKSGAWSTTSPNNGHHNGNKTVKFAANATVAIGLGERELAAGDKVVAWASEPTTVVFTNADWYLKRRADGVYVNGTQAPGAAILPMSVPVQYIRGGAPAEPDLHLVNAATGEELVKGTDYTVVYSDNAAPGTATVTVTGAGTYAGLAFTDEFTIGESFAASAAVPPAAYMDGTLDWTGVAVTDVVTGAALVEGTDYSYTYTLSGSTATATIKGRGYYAGTTVEYTFEIAPMAYFTDFRSKIEITVGEGMVTTELVNFPALVRLSSEAIDGFNPTDCGEGGSELAFLMEDGGEMLPCEVDYWNPEGESTVWVKVPTLAADTKIYAVIGRKDGRAAIASSPKRVWGDYVGVWHFSEASGIARDSSPNGYHTTNNGGGTVSNLNSKVGLARNTNGTAFNTGVNYLTGSSKAKPISNKIYFTVSGWEYSSVDIASAAKKYPQLFRKGAYNGTGWFTGWEGTSRKFNGVGGSTTRSIPELPYSVYNNWVYITVAFNNTTCLIYENGALASSYTIGAAKDDNVELTMALDLTGRIDEFRIRDGVEAAAYVAADYKTMTEANFFEYGAVEPTGLPVYFAPIPAQRIRGAAVEPPPALTNTDTKAELVLGTDYTVEYENNTLAGTGRAVVTGAGKYAGYADARTFEILPAFEVSIPAATIRPDGTIPWQSGWVTDAETGDALAATDYSYVVTADPANHSGRAVVTGRGGYAGATVTNEFAAKTVILVGGYTVAEEGTGFSWDSPVSLGKAITMFNAAPDNYSEIWMKSGVYSLTATLAWTFNTAAVVIRGGFAGTENSPAERDPAARTEFYGGGTRGNPIGIVGPRDCMDLINSKPVVFDGVDITCGRFGLTKTGAGALTLLNCGILHNYINSENTDPGTPDSYDDAKFRDYHAGQWYGGCAHGCGLRIRAPGADVVVSNCVIAGNIGDASYQNGAPGLLVWGAKSVTVSDTLIASNGLNWARSTAPENGHRGRGRAIWLHNAPTTFERCRIVGHWSGTVGYDTNGDSCNIYIAGASGGTRFDHCVIAGNMITHGNNTADGNSSYAGNMLVDLSTADATVEFDHCTVAYNFSMKSKAACALSVNRGTMVIRNSIFAHNLRGNSSTVGSDLHLLTSSAFAEVYHTLFTADATTSVSSYTPANLTIGSGVLYGDPLLATGLATVNGWKDSYRFTAANLSKLVAMNLHPLSKTGYVGDDGEWKQSEDQHSPAIDTGDLSDPVGDEPEPNGGVVNLGAYGGTAEASKSDESYTLAVQDVAIAFDDEYSRPTVSFIVGGSGSFTASAEILWSTNGNDWVFGTTLNGLTLGDTPSYALPLYVPPGSMWARVTLRTATVMSDAADSDETPVTKPLPPWYGKKGPANVVHVRVGAIGAGDGTSWSDAFTTLRAAFAATSAEKNEIWIATNTVSLAQSELDAAVSVGNALTVRGGFKGWEETADERPEGAVSTVDGVNRSVCLNLSNSAAVTVERMRFYRGLAHGFQKSGAGDITLVDCRFESTSTTPGHNNGRGMHATGSSGTTRFTAERCVFANNLTPSGYNSGSGGSGIGAFVQNFARAIFDDCIFEGNGDVNRAGGWLYGVCAGSALFANASPTTMRGCRILANTGNVATQYGGGGTYLIDGRLGSTVIFNGNCSGSAMTNCVVAGNGVLAGGSGSHPSCDTAAIAVFMGAADRTLDIVNCTIAYNIGIGVNSPGGVNVVSGAVTMKNSVVYGNWRWNGTENNTRHAADVDVKAGASFAADWSLFTADSTNSVDGASGAAIALGDGVVYGDPLFVTLLSAASPKQYVTTAEGQAGRAFYANSATLAFRKAINTHLRGARGYFDEKTGELVTDYMTRETVSPAQDAGDPRSDYRGEPDTNDGWHGRRVNMGAWGNTPWATRTKFLHGAVYVR